MVSSSSHTLTLRLLTFDLIYSWALHCCIHLAQLIPRWFLKPVVCKYPITVNKSEINILLPKPYSLMWHLVRGNCVRNGRDKRTEHAECVHQKLHFWKFLLTVCSTTQSTVESMMTRMMSTVFMCGRNRPSSRSPNLCWFNEYVHIRVVVLQCSAYRNFQKCKFSEQVLSVLGFLLLPFLTRFPHMRCHIQGQGFGNKMYISELFTVVGYLHTTGFKNCWGIDCAKCSFFTGGQKVDKPSVVEVIYKDRHHGE